MIMQKNIEDILSNPINDLEQIVSLQQGIKNSLPNIKNENEAKDFLNKYGDALSRTVITLEDILQAIMAINQKK